MARLRVRKKSSSDDGWERGGAAQVVDTEIPTQLHGDRSVGVVRPEDQVFAPHPQPDHPLAPAVLRPERPPSVGQQLC